MEADPNPMPKFELFQFPILHRLGRCAVRCLSFLPAEAPDFMSEHYRGGAAMLDRELYDNPDQLQLDFEDQSAVGW